MQNNFKKNWILYSILAASFLLCAFYAFYFQIKPQVDAQAYDQIGQNIALGHGYRSNLGGDLAKDGSIIRVGPLYEYFLGAIYWIFGHSYPAVWIFQAFLHILSAWLIYLTCLLIFSRWEYKKAAALWAAGIFAFYPDLIESSAMVLTETLYLFLTCLFLHFFFLLFGSQKKWLAGVLGLCVGLATLARPTILFLVPVIIFYFWQKKDWKRGVIFLAVLFLVFTPWTVRNYQIFGKVMPFGAAGAFNFWIGNYHGGNGEQEPTEAQQRYQGAHGFQDLQDESIRQFKTFVREYPGEFVKLTALRANKYFSVIRPMGFWFYQSGWGQFLFILSSAASSVLLFVLGLAGLLKGIKSKIPSVYYLSAFVIITPLINCITVVETRYRFQIYPLLAILAGFYLSYLISQRRAQKEFWIAALIVLSNGSLDFILSFDRFKERISQFF